MVLSNCQSGQIYKIKKVNAKGKLFYKMLDMGFIAGADVEIVREAPFFDPMELKIQNYLVAIRRSEAELIEVESL
ncbi:ferrous iron transport protein A [Campylobacter sp. FMV-PI01]|uniref:Ferrous iron transport protein A n=1 Tax=Campylobacter portucalensis TaxID=2608384 RepID=A0A6L5WJQ8_9BACT|nr:FeoA family protein [Campylobacter portucalensis]MSN96682.1 ferrous iron transport protein A [Campylobacter portucalensis]